MEEKQPEDKIIWRLLLCYTNLQQQVLDESRDNFSSEKVKRFAQYVRNFARVHTEAFMILCAANNYVAAHHFYRLISDCALRVYAVTLFEGKKLDRCLDKFFEGEEPKEYPKYKGKDLEPKYILELIKQEDVYGDIIPAFQKEGNRSTHFSSFYEPEMAETITDEDKKDMIGYYSGLICFLGALLFRLQ